MHTLLHPIRVWRGKRAAKWLRSQPPGYGEQYTYRSYFDPEPYEPAPMLRPMPDPNAEHTSIISAFQAMTACRVCGYRARICSSDACPQRRG